MNNSLKYKTKLYDLLHKITTHMQIIVVQEHYTFGKFRGRF